MYYFASGSPFFNRRDNQKLRTADLGVALEHALALLDVNAPSGCYYASRSAPIGGFNELLVLQFTREWIMNRLDWASPNMFSMYCDSRSTVTAASEWFFARMRTPTEKRITGHQAIAFYLPPLRQCALCLCVSVQASVDRDETPRRMASGCNYYQLTERTSYRSPAAP